MRANTRFRLCLRVAQTGDSQAMLKRPEAASLTGTGRAYFQVGVNEVFDLFQVAWSGAPYDPSGAESRSAREICEVALDGTRRCIYTPPVEHASGETSQLQALVKHIASIAGDCHELESRRLRDLWHDPLPDQLALEDIRSGPLTVGGWDGKIWQPTTRWLDPVIGLLDDPAHGSQPPLRVNLGKEGHFALYGATRYGKTIFVETLVMSLALDHSPDDVNLYLLDFGGRFLKAFEHLPHVGGVVVADEPERLSRLLTYLQHEIELRKTLFEPLGAMSLPDYRRATDNFLPAIIVVLDNYDGFFKTYEDHEDAIAQLVREGATFGVHLVLTAHNTASVRFKVSSNITLAAALNLGDQGDYGAIVGRTGGLLPAAVPGRGLIRGTPALEFPTALPAKGETDPERRTALKQTIDQLAEDWRDRQRAPQIQVLPEVVKLAELLPPGEGWAAPLAQAGGALAVPIGVAVDDLSPFSVDLTRGPNYLIVGSVQTGQTTLLQTGLLALAERVPPNDSTSTSWTPVAWLAPLADLPHATYAAQADTASRVLTEVERLVQDRKRVLRILRAGRPPRHGRLSRTRLRSRPPW